MTLRRAIACAIVAVAIGCGSDSPPGHPDTGAGAGQTVPATPNCVDLCLRGATCNVTLCDEDTHSTQYDSFLQTFQSLCASGCTDAAVQGITAAQWQCLFQSSCRQVFEHNACGGMSTYSC